MKTEIEAKFLNVDLDQIRGKLEEFGAVCEQPMRLMKRAIIETPEMKKQGAYLRVRDEGDKVMVTFKKFDSLSLDGAKETEIEVKNFDQTVGLLAKLELKHHSIQESKRETWRLDNTEVVLDEWPWLKPYIEVEGETKTDVKGSAKKLGLKWEEAVFGDVMVAYRAQYPHLKEDDTVSELPEVRFSDPLPRLLIAP